MYKPDRIEGWEGGYADKYCIKDIASRGWTVVGQGGPIIAGREGGYC